MKVKSAAVILFLCVLAAGFGCGSKSATGPVFSSVSTPKDKAVVYFFRPKQVSGSGAAIFMSIPEAADNCYAMRNNGYYAYTTDPGQLKVFSAIYKKQKSFTLNLKPGDKKYIKVSFGTWGDPEYEEVQEEKAMRMISKSRQISTCRK